MNQKKLGIIVLISLIAFLSPLLIHLKGSVKISNFHFSLPQIYSGDEPHYLLGVSSIIEDYDLAVGNNYDNARFKGSYSAGAEHAGQKIDHHTFFFNDDKKTINWDQIYDFKSFTDFSIEERRWPGKEEFDLTGYREYLFHPIGMPLLASVFLWPLAHSKYLESGAILFTAIISITGFYFLYKTLFFYSKNRELSVLITGITVFATPLWHYSRSFFADPYIAAILITAFYFFRIEKNYIFAGFLMGLCFLIKWPSVLFSFIFLAYLALKKDVRGLLGFGLPLSLFVLLQCLYSYYFFGSPLHFSLPEMVSFNVFHNFWNSLFSPTHGFLIFAPFLVFSFIGFYYLFKSNKEQTFLILSLILIYFAFFTFHPDRDQYSYGPRELLPTIPFFAIPILYWFKNTKNPLILALFFVAVGLSLLLTALSVFGFNNVFEQTPVRIVSFFFKGY